MLDNADMLDLLGDWIFISLCTHRAMTIPHYSAEKVWMCLHVKVPGCPLWCWLEIFDYLQLASTAVWRIPSEPTEVVCIGAQGWQVPCFEELAREAQQNCCLSWELNKLCALNCLSARSRTNPYMLEEVLWLSSLAWLISVQKVWEFASLLAPYYLQLGWCLN